MVASGFARAQRSGVLQSLCSSPSPRESKNIFSSSARPSNEDPSRLAWAGPETQMLKLRGCGRGVARHVNLFSFAHHQQQSIHSFRISCSSPSHCRKVIRVKQIKQQIAAWGFHPLVRLSILPCSATFPGLQLARHPLIGKARTPRTTTTLHAHAVIEGVEAGDC